MEIVIACLATISLSLRDKSRSPIEGPRIKLTLTSVSLGFYPLDARGLWSGNICNLDGEMVVLDGRVYQIKGSRQVFEASDTAEAPLAVLTRFSPEVDQGLNAIADFDDLKKHCDSLRSSGNIFYAFRLDGTFRSIRTRAVSPPEEGTRLVDAAKAQSEFYFADVAGTLVRLMVARLLQRQRLRLSLSLYFRRPASRRPSSRLPVGTAADADGAFNRFPSRTTRNGGISQSRSKQEHCRRIRLCGISSLGH